MNLSLLLHEAFWKQIRWIIWPLSKIDQLTCRIDMCTQNHPSQRKSICQQQCFFFVPGQPCTLMNVVLTVWTSSGYPHMIYTHGSLGSLEYKSWLVMARSSRWWTCIQIKLSVIWRMIITGGGQWSIWCRSWRLWCRGNWRQEHCYQHVETHELHYLKVEGQEVGL